MVRRMGHRSRSFFIPFNGLRRGTPKPTTGGAKAAPPLDEDPSGPDSHQQPAPSDSGKPVRCDRRHAIDENVAHPLGQLVRLLVGGAVSHRGQIEDHHIGEGAGPVR